MIYIVPKSIRINNTMKKPPYLISTIVMFTVMLTTIISHAHETDANDDITESKNQPSDEIFTSLANVSYAKPEWNNNEYFSIGFRTYYTDLETQLRFYLDFELGGTTENTSPIDGLTRNSLYEKIGTGYVFNKGRAETTLFTELGFGLINIQHYVEGVAAWRSPESDEIYHDRVVYQNSGGFLIRDSGSYFHIAAGVRIKKHHKLTLYIDYVNDGPLSARNIQTTDYPDETYYYYGEIPQGITEHIIGLRYSFAPLY